MTVRVSSRRCRCAGRTSTCTSTSTTPPWSRSSKRRGSRFSSRRSPLDITTIGLLIADVRVTYKGQLRLADSPLQVTIWVKRLRAVDFTLGYEVRSVNADPESKPAVIAESQLAAFHIEEQRLVRLAPHHREYLQRWLRE